MPFQRTSPAPERQFLYAEANGGKTYSIMCIARKLATTGSPSRMFFIDTDNSYYDMMDEFPEVENTVVPMWVDQEEEGREWYEFDDTIKKALKDANPGRGDWVVVDRADPGWEWVQDAYAREARSRSIDELRAEGRKKVDSGEDKNLRAGLKGFEWGEVKSKFRKPFNRLVVSGCNIIITAGAATISQYTDPNNETRNLFGGLPWAPGGGAGSKLLSHLFRDIFHLRCVSLSKGEFVISSAKARGRKVKFSNEPIKDYAFTVMMKCCGWRVRGDGKVE